MYRHSLLLRLIVVIGLVFSWLTIPAQPTSRESASNWNDNPGKGQVRLSFADAVASGQAGKDRVPFGKQTYSVRSPNGTWLLTYTYDYASPTLLVNGQISGGKSGDRTTFQLPIDDGFTNHGLAVDDQGEVFVFNTSAEDALYVIRYEPNQEESQVLEVGPSGSRRNRFIPFLGFGKVYVANVCENQAGELTGVLVSVFNFKAGRVEDVQFHPVSAELKKKMGSRLPEGHYDLIRFEVKLNGEKGIELEKHAIAANSYRYDPYAVVSPVTWEPRKQQVQLGEKLIFRLNADGKILSEEVVEQYKAY